MIRSELLWRFVLVLFLQQAAFADVLWDVVNYRLVCRLHNLHHVNPSVPSPIDPCPLQVCFLSPAPLASSPHPCLKAYCMFECDVRSLEKGLPVWDLLISLTCCKHAFLH